MEIFYKPSALKPLKKLPRPEIKKVIRKIEELAKDPLAGKKLKGEFADLNSLRAWPYRIIYEVNQTGIIIYSIAHRQGAYN